MGYKAIRYVTLITITLRRT